jgi:hypothetical protein
MRASECGKEVKLNITAFNLVDRERKKRITSHQEQIEKLEKMSPNEYLEVMGVHTSGSFELAGRLVKAGINHLRFHTTKDVYDSVGNMREEKITDEYMLPSGEWRAYELGGCRDLVLKPERIEEILGEKE